MKKLDLIPDIVIFNGCIHTIDEKNSVYDALAIKDGKIIAIGYNEEILSLAECTTKTIDLKNQNEFNALLAWICYK